MRVVPSAAVRLCVALVAAPLAAGCASPLRHPGADQGGTRLVATDEPLHPGPDSLGRPDQQEASWSSDLALAAARLVANDGEPGHRVWRQEPAPSWTSCSPSAFVTPSDPLTDGGVYRAVDPLEAASAWMGVGLAFGPADVTPWLFPTACGRSGHSGSPGERLAHLAPSVASRDTSLLFTTARAPRTGATVPGWVGQLVDQVTHRGDSPEPGPRTAKPRPAEPAARAAEGAEATRGDVRRAPDVSAPARGDSPRGRPRGRR